MSAWIKVTDELPQVDVDVLVLTKNNVCVVSKMYTPKDCHGRVLGDKMWKGSSSFNRSVVAWTPIPSTEEIISDIKENEKGR